MSAGASALLAALALAVAAAVVAMAAPARWRARASGPLIVTSGGGIAVAGLAALGGERWAVDLPMLLPFAGLRFGADALAGWFLFLVGAVTAVVGVYTVGYAGRVGHGPGSRAALGILPLFTAAMALVPVAASVPTFLLAWELMAITSLLLLVTEHGHHSAVRSAVGWYAAMTQAGFVTVLIGLTWLASAASNVDFAGVRAHSAVIAPATKALVFLLCLAGFASKAGVVPLHPWLPRAHAEAPSHVSALMSAAMVKLGLYGILRVGFDLLGGGPRWWWLVVGALGAMSALYGILQAAVAKDIKRLLAFSTSENIGLILIGIGFAGIVRGPAQAAIAALALTAALLHSLNHAGFKALLFLGAGSVVRATGIRDLDQLGGLSRRMPMTTAFVAAGALAAAALPPGNGFISEWLLLQALLHQGGAGTIAAVAAPIGVAVVATTAGVGIATYVKAVGTGLLARPRSTAAAEATESPASMVTGMALAAIGCAALAIGPALAVPGIVRVLNELHIAGLNVRDVNGLTARIWPLWLAVAVVGATVVVGLAARALGRARRRAIAWDCGDGPLTARMEYTATSFAEPLQRVFDDALAPERDVDVTHHEESVYVLEEVRFRQRIPDRIENRLYRPLIDGVARLGQAARRLAPGGVHRYLAYMLGALVLVLVAGVLPR